jgi:outer membrane protein assembly factor BamB
MKRVAISGLGALLILLSLLAQSRGTVAALPGCSALPASATGLVAVLSTPARIDEAVANPQGEVVPPADRAPMGNLVAQWSACLAAGDVRGLLGLFSADGVRRLLSERAPLVGGPGGLQIRVQAVNDVVRLPDGRLAGRVVIDPSGSGSAAPMTLTMVIVRGADGAWRIDALVAPDSASGSVGTLTANGQVAPLLRRPIAPGPDTPVAAPGPTSPMRGGDPARSGNQPGPPPAAAPPEAWRAPTGWFSRAQPVVGRGLVIFGGFSLGGRLSVVEALDSGRGGVRWQTTAPVGWAEIPDTPALAGDLLFAPVQAPVSGVMAMVAWTGQPVWFAPFGFTSVTAPAADGDTVYVAGWGVRNPRAGGLDDSVGSVFALDQNTGRERWRFIDGARFGPLAVGREMVYVSSNRGLFALARTNGQKRWQARFAPLPAEAPVVIGDAVVLAGTDVTSGATGVFALDAATGALRWRVDLDASLSVGLGTAAADDTVYVAWWEAPTADSVGVPVLSAYSLSDGKERWVYRASVTQEELAAATGATITAPAITGDRVLFGVAVQAPSDTPATRASGVYAIDTASGQLSWQVAGLEVASAPVVVADTVYVMGGGPTTAGRGSSVIALRPG